MASSPKFPIERRRRQTLSQGPFGVSKEPSTPPMRRESDVVRARLQRWMELADTALGVKKTPPLNGHSKR